MDKSKRSRLMGLFLEEVAENVRVLEQGLMALEKKPPEADGNQHLQAIFRAAHSLKGAARSVNVTLIETACHHLESVLETARDGRVPFDGELFALLYKAVDALEEAGQRLREDPDLAGAPLASLLPQLEAAARGEKARATPAAPPPQSSPAPRALEETREPVPVPRVAGTPPLPAADGMPRPAPPTASVRVPAARLDALLARTGELLVARRRMDARVAELAILCEFVEQWQEDWHRVERCFAPLLPGERETADGAALLPRRAALVLARAGENLRRLDEDLERLRQGAVSDTRLLRQVAGPLNEEVHRARMLPFAEACDGLERMVRDLNQATGKEVDLLLEGGAVELDRGVLEGLKDPLRHIVRNAVDHGAEAPAQRRAAGKSPRALVKVSAALRGARVEVVVEDDGHGLDFDALRQQARRRGLAEPADERALAGLIFLPGLSTAAFVTDVSGRGVGLDVVKTRLEGLHGTVDVSSVSGVGTRFTLTVPLTLTTLRAVLAGAAGHTFAFVGTSVERLVRVSSDDLKPVAGRPMLALGGPPLPVTSLAAALGFSAEALVPATGKRPALIVAVGERRVAFVVDELLAEQEIVVQSLGARVRRLPHVSGATLLPSGKVALVLNAANLVRSALGQTVAVVAVEAAAAALPARKRLLVVDDSVTTRTLEKSILESAGYEVTAAADGLAAWQVLQEQGADLVVSDVEMPRMDGFALTETVRGSKRFRELPVVLVTSRESEPDKARGLEVGADAYLIKSGFDQRKLLQTIAQLL